MSNGRNDQLGSMPWTCLGDPNCAANGGPDPVEYQGGLYGPNYGTGYVGNPPAHYGGHGGIIGDPAECPDGQQLINGICRPNGYLGPPIVQQLPPVMITAPAPAATLPTAAQPSSSVWDQPVSTQTVLLVAGAIAAVVALSMLKR